MDSSLAAIKAIRAKLVAANVATGKVYNQAPQPAPAKPFVVLSIASTPLETIKTTYFSHRVRAQAWSEVSLAAVVGVRSAIYDALHRQTLTVDSPFLFSSCQVDTLIDAFLEPDNKTFQAVIEFDVVLTL